VRVAAWFAVACAGAFVAQRRLATMQRATIVQQRPTARNAQRPVDAIVIDNAHAGGTCPIMHRATTFAHVHA